MRSLSFRARLGLTMGALILLVATAIWVYLPRKLEKEAVELLAHKAETLAQLTAFTIHPSIYFQDRAALEEALRGTTQDRDVAYVIVTDSAGKTLAAFHPERAGDPSLYKVKRPIREAGRDIAQLQIGLSLARLRHEVSRTRVDILILGAIVLAAGLAAALLISRILTRPLRDVARGAQRIARGELDSRVDIHRDDEIGQLAAAFNDMAEKVAERDASLRALSRRLLSIQEEERIRIAREVHDELGQALTAMKIGLQHKPPAELAATIDQTVDLVRRIATDLRPAVLDDLGITAALEQQLRLVRESTGIRTTLSVDEEPQLDKLTSVTLYRIAQEALSNVMRHANASEVHVSLGAADGTLALEIRDNGRGIAGQPAGLGLLGIRERAEMLGGKVVISSDQGTTLRVTLPCERSA
jgi:signal transduction histidine kinase